jgi:hypothetical protein
MHQDPLLAIEVGNGAAATRSRYEARVNSKHPQTAVESFRINYRGAIRAFVYRALNGFSCRVVCYGYCLFCHFVPQEFQEGKSTLSSKRPAGGRYFWPGKDTAGLRIAASLN